MKTNEFRPKASLHRKLSMFLQVVLVVAFGLSIWRGAWITAMTIALFTFVGEALLIFWCLWKGIKGIEPLPEIKNPA